MEKQTFKNLAAHINLHAVRREHARQREENGFLYATTGYRIEGLAKYDQKLADLLQKVDVGVKELDIYIIGRVETPKF